MKYEKIKLMCFAGIFTAIVFVFTAYLHIPNTVYIRKSRIKRQIEESDSAQKAALLEMMS